MRLGDGTRANPRQSLSRRRFKRHNRIASYKTSNFYRRSMLPTKPNQTDIKEVDEPLTYLFLRENSQVVFEQTPKDGQARQGEPSSSDTAQQQP
ncbi:hypothetical protein NC651_023823 [Populus alba x Populus x berolinensis]|nr:hypothetical protein NC651_023823 [Populus alba x Populus x berolinensis]